MRLSLFALVASLGGACSPAAPTQAEQLAVFKQFEAAVLANDKAKLAGLVDPNAALELQPLLDRMSGHGAYAKLPDAECLSSEATEARSDASGYFTIDYLRRVLPGDGPVELRASDDGGFYVLVPYNVTQTILNFGREQGAWRLVGLAPPIEEPPAPEFRCARAASD